MSLIVCPECGEKVSDKAVSCVHCGLPLSNLNSETRYEVAFNGRVPRKSEDYVMTEIFRRLGITIDEAQKITLTENAVVKTDMDFLSAEALRDALCGEGAPAVVREVGGEIVKRASTRCPSCGSTRFVICNQNFSVGKAALGAVIAGPVGALAGFAGSESKYRVCSKCRTDFLKINFCIF